MPSLTVLSALNTSAIPARARAKAVSAEVSNARPDLSPVSEEFQAAVLLLLLCDGGGFNVDRLVARSGLPRRFVSLCLRRLADNAWWTEGQIRCSWIQERAESEYFWLDTDVALGRRLRRIDQRGEFEWASIREWMKDFEYTKRDPVEEPIFSEYRKMPTYNPEPESTACDAEIEESPAQVPVSERDRYGEDGRRTAAHHAIETAHQFVSRRTQGISTKQLTATASTKPLVAAWAEAAWMG